MESNRLAGHTTALAILATSLVACGGTTAGGAPGPDSSLMVRAPSAPTVQVMRYDTSTVSVDTGVMGTIEMAVEDAGTIDMSFGDDPAGVLVTATYSSFSGGMSNPMAGSITVDESDIEGQLVFTLDSRGHASVRERFEVSQNAAQMVGGAALAYDLFPRFPAGGAAGQSWVDTVSVEEEGEFTSATTTITTYTMAGDTTVDGKSLVRLNTSSDVDVSTSGEQQGMAMTQNLSGTATGWMLWDAGASLPYAMYNESELAGIVSVAMPGAPDMAMTVTGRQHTRLAY